jgi:hypothetical protein
VLDVVHLDGDKDTFLIEDTDPRRCQGQSWKWEGQGEVLFGGEGDYHSPRYIVERDLSRLMKYLVEVDWMQWLMSRREMSLSLDGGELFLSRNP